MSVNANGYWMDRLGAAPAVQDEAAQSTVSPAPNQKLHQVEVARAALRDRTGITQKQLLWLARERRRALLQANRPARILLAAGLFATGIAVALAGHLLPHQLLLLSGLGLAFIGLLAGCSILVAMIGPQAGELDRHLREDEAPASIQDMTWLVRATRSDPELRHLTLAWWKDNAVLIRKQDVDLVRAFQRAKAEQ